MIKHLIMTSVIFTFLYLLTGCTPKNTSSYISVINADQAKKMMDTEDNIVILDVRTLEEFQAGHIENSILIPHTQIESEAANLIGDKNATILIYCRSGSRSANAAKYLEKLGFTKIYDFGGINKWPYGLVNK